jgi:hypothetical protein
MNLRSLAFGAGVFAALNCAPPVGPADRLPFGDLTAGVDATVVWLDLEGGFWALETTEGRFLDPHSTLPAAYRVDGLRVQVATRTLTDAACFHMVGPIVAVTGIRTR